MGESILIAMPVLSRVNKSSLLQKTLKILHPTRLFVIREFTRAQCTQLLECRHIPWNNATGSAFFELCAVAPRKMRVRIFMAVAQHFWNAPGH